MSNCKHVSRLLSDALDRRLSPEEEDRVRQHLTICPACQNCRQHFLKLRTWRDTVRGEPAAPEPRRV